MAWTIRRADFDDAPGIGRVQLESWRVTYGEFLPDEYLDGMSDVRHAAMWSEVLSKGDRIGATFIAEDDDQGVIGFADCAPSKVAQEDDENDEDVGDTDRGTPGEGGRTAGSAADDEDVTGTHNPAGDRGNQDPAPSGQGGQGGQDDQGDQDDQDDQDDLGGSLRSGEIGSIYVLPNWQRQGVGRGFIANAARHLASYEFQTLVVWVLHDDPARAFYEKLGGDACALREIQFIDTTLVQVCYQWLDISELVLIDLTG